MRTLRGAITLAIAGVLVAALPATAANAAPPSAPYTAFTLDGGDSPNLLNGTLSFDLDNTDTFYFGPNGDSPTPDNIHVQVHNADHLWSALIVPPAGTTFAAGMTYETRRFPENDSQATFDVAGDFVGCNEERGSLTVKEITRQAGKVTAFAASFKASCDLVPEAINGEIRWNSSIGYVAAVGDKSLLDFGSAYAESTTASQTVRFTATGSQPITFGAASFAGGAPGAYAVAADTCSRSTLAYGQTCTVQVAARPTAVGPQAANLVLPDNTSATKKIVRLTVDGKDPRTVALTPASLEFGSADPDVDGGPLKVTVTANGTKPITLGTPSIAGTTPTAFKITGSTCTGVTLAVGQRCEVSVAPHATTTGDFQSASLLIPDNSLRSPKVVPLSLYGEKTPRGTYYPLAPQRLLDTRHGLGAPKVAVGAGKTIHLQVTGRGGVPLSGVSAVVLNVTATAPTATTGYLTVFPTGVARPTASSLNFSKGWTGANSVTVAVGTGGKVDIFNSGGSTHVIADVAGYFASDNTTQNHGYMGGAYQPVTPTRLLDTRKGSKLPAGYYINAAASWGTAINPHVKAFAVNITAVSPSSTGYLTAWDGSPYIPTTSTLNYTAGKIVPNMAIVPASPCFQCGKAEGWPSIGVLTSANTHVLVDIVGFFDDSTLSGGLRFTPITPTRIADSRSRLGLAGPIGPGKTATITAPGAVAFPGTEALALNVTAVAPTAATYETVWPSGIAKPTVSNLNPAAHQTVPNAVIAGLGAGNGFNVYNNVGTTGLVVDVVGTYWLYPGTAGASAAAAARAAAATAKLPDPTVFDGTVPRKLS